MNGLISCGVAGMILTEFFCTQIVSLGDLKPEPVLWHEDSRRRGPDNGRYFILNHSNWDSIEILFSFQLCFFCYLTVTTLDLRFLSGITLLEPFLVDNWGKRPIAWLLIAYRWKQTTMGMAIRCTVTHRLMLELSIIRHNLPTQIIGSMIRDIIGCRRLELFTLLKANTNHQSEVPVFKTIAVIMVTMNDTLHQVAAILTMGLNLNIMREITEWLPSIPQILGTYSINQELIIMLAPCTLMVLWHKLHLGLVPTLTRVVTTSIRTTNQLGLLAINISGGAVLVVGFHRHRPAQTLPGGTATLTNRVTNSLHWTEEQVGDRHRHMGMAAIRVVLLFSPFSFLDNEVVR